VALITVIVIMLSFTLTPSAEEISEKNEDNIINVWLIGGQSNAVGYGKNAPAGAAEDSRYYTGFENVLYFGNHEQWKYNEDDFVPTTIGLGRTADNNDVRYTSSGSEIGIAKALGDTGEMNAIIKFAYGGTYLYPKQSASINDNAKTWTSPSYIQAHPEMNTGANIGALYNLFVDTVTEGLSLLREKGYTPVIKGMWWMQGENEGMNATHAAAYEELLTCLVNDVRAELENITGLDHSDMPFICGNVMRNPSDATQYPALETVNAAQDAVAKTLNNVGVLTKADYSSQSFFGYHDGWHFNVDTYNYMGEKFVEMVLDMTKENLVSVVGEGIEVAGNGIKGENENVTITINVKDGYTVNGVTMAGNSVALDENGSYTFTMTSSDVVFNVNTTQLSTDAVTDYGTIPSGFNIPEKYPFALFNNGSFVGAYEYYGKALSSVPTLDGADECVLLLRRDYTTVTADSSTAVSEFGGSFTLDLGGNAMVRGNRAYVFEIYSNNNNTYKTALNVKNGSMYSTGDFSLISLNYSSLSNVSKTYNINFENVVFETHYNGRGTPVIIDTLDGAYATDSAGLTANVTFNGCTFDFGVTSGTMMKFSDAAAAKTVVNAKISGGSIVSKTASYTLYSSSAEDKVAIGQLNGSYPTVTLPTSVTPPAYTYTTEDGEIYGIAQDSGVVSGENTVYNMGVQSLNTKYGAIGEEFKDSQTYKFALFKVDSASATGYTFISGYTTFKNVCNAAGLKGSPVESGVDFVILLRTSFTNEEGVDNMQKIYSKVDIDLGGNTVTLTKQHFLPLYDNPSSDTEYSKITIKNGTILLNSPSHTGITAITVDSGTLTKKLTYNVAAENVTFKVASGSKSLNGAVSMSGNKGTNNLILNATFTNCTFDYTGAPTGTAMFNVSATQRIANVNIIGGKIIADTNNAFTFANMDSGDTISFKANANGLVAELYLASGTAAPTKKIGNLEFVYDRAENGNDVYTLVEKHTYGDIPARYTSADDYPVLLFKADKTFVRGYASFAEAAIAAGLVNGGTKSQVGGADAVILFRCDHVHIGESGNMNGYYNNVTIDLGGHTVQIGSETVKKNFLVLYPNASYTDDKSTFGTITVKNGTFKNMWDNTAALCFNGGGNVSDNITYTVNYENVTFTVRNYTNKIYGAIRTWSGAAKNIKLNATYTDCTFDYTGANTNAGMFGLSYNSNITTVFNINVVGGKIIAGANNAFNFIEADANDNITLEGTTLLQTAGTAAHTGKYNDGAMSFTYSATENGYDVYTLTEVKDEASVETNYGTIPGEYASMPIVVFKSDKTFIGAYTTFADAVTAAGMANGASGSLVGGADAVILFRDNYTHGSGINMHTFYNNVIIDLGGYNVTLNGHFLQFYIYRNETQALEFGKITVKNGKFINSSPSNTTISPLRVDGGGLVKYDVTYNVDFENVTFSVASASKSMIGAISTNVNAAATATGKNILNVNLYNCTYDFENSAAGAIMFDVDTTMRVANINIIGGKILGGSNGSFKFIEQDADDNVLIVKDSSGKYTSLSLVKGTAAPTARYNENTMGYMYASSSGNYDNYELALTVDSSISITVNDTNLAKYALTVYVNGEVVSLPYNASLLTGSIVKIVAKSPSDHNYSITIDGNAVSELTLTLNADTNVVIGITEKSSAVKVPISSVTSTHSSANDTSWDETKLIDGNRVSSGSSYGYSTGSLGAQTLTNPVILTFDLGAVKTINQLSMFPRSDRSALDPLLSANYPIDFTISVSTDGSQYKTVLTVTGENPMFPKQQCYNFDDVDARYVKLTITKISALVSDEANSNRYRVQLAEVEIYNNTELTTVKTDYGTIPNGYIDADKYPIVVFKADKTFVKGFATYKEALIAAGFNGVSNSLVNGEDCVILFRENYTHVNSNQMIGAFYNNVVMDLGGNTVTLSNQHFLALYGAGTPANGTTFGTITIKNGSFINNSANTTVTPVRLDGKWSVKVTYTVKIENVKFAVASTSGSSLGAVSTAAPGGTANVLNVTLTNCIFDFANSKNGTSMINVSTERVVNAVICDGKVIAGGNNSFNLIMKDSADKVVFAENSSGEYIKLVLNKDTAAPSTNTVYTTENGVDCVFVKVSDDGTNATYKLYPKAMVGYKIKTSVTLWSNFVYNIYIPKVNVNSFTINGVAMAYEEIEIDGVAYYHVAVNLPAGETLQDIKVSVKLNSGATTVDANWTLNVLNYTKSVINGSYDDTTKTLMKDMLVYANAAYTYFGNTLEAEKSATVATLLEGYTKVIPTGEAKKPTDKTYFTDVAVYLGEVPSFRFTLAEGYTADNFTFKVGNRNATVIAGDGYVEIVMYAYMMLDDVTFTVKGTNVTESYNLYAYYEYAKTLNNANLTAIVEALIKYSVSAKAYRESVVK